MPPSSSSVINDPPPRPAPLKAKLGSVILPSAVIWVVNPFDQLPNETDVPLRYWTLCRMLAKQGHAVIWWSSDFSHLTKSKRHTCPDTDGFSVRLIETPPYTKNISFARLKNHRQFAQGFYREAMAALQRGDLASPDRIVVSLPPLGVAEAAFSIREYLQKAEVSSQQSGKNAGSAGASRTASTQGNQPSTISHPSSQRSCQVVVDIMDAWPETFYRALPAALRKPLGSLLLRPMHQSARRAYQGADKISAVGQSYLDLTQAYLTGSAGASRTAPQASRDTLSNIQTCEPSHSSAKPMLLCYHGTGLARFAQRAEDRGQETDDSHCTAPPPHDGGHNRDQEETRNKQQTTNNNQPLKAVYLGSMGTGYDLETIIQVAAHWQAEGRFPFQIHFAGTGSQANQLMANSESLIAEKRIVFHGYLKSEAITKLLLSSDLALVPNRPTSLVACPYKAGEYAAAGLPMISCLGGELNERLAQWNAGSEYKEGDAASLQAAFEKYLSEPEILKQQSLNTRKMAEALFDRETTYQELTEFILS